MTRIALIIWLGAFAADGVTGHLAMNRGAREVWLPTQQPWVIDGALTGACAASWWGEQRLLTQHPKIARTIYWSTVGLHVAVAAHNFKELTKVPAEFRD